MLTNPVTLEVDPTAVSESTWHLAGTRSTKSGGYLWEMRGLDPGVYETRIQVEMDGHIEDGPVLRSVVNNTDEWSYNVMQEQIQALHEKVMARGGDMRAAYINGVRAQRPGMSEAEVEGLDYTAIEQPYGYGYLMGAVQEPFKDARLTGGAGLTVSPANFRIITDQHAAAIWGVPALSATGVISSVLLDGLSDENTDPEYRLFAVVAENGESEYQVRIFADNSCLIQVAETETTSEAGRTLAVFELSSSGVTGTLQLDDLTDGAICELAYEKRLRLYGAVTDEGAGLVDLVLYDNAERLDEHIVARLQSTVSVVGTYSLRWAFDPMVHSAQASGVIELNDLTPRTDIVIDLWEQRHPMAVRHYIRRAG